jgi:hypothetical protein
MEHNKPRNRSASRLAATLHFSFNFSTPVAHFPMVKVVAALRVRRRGHPFFPHATLTHRGVPFPAFKTAANAAR